MGAAFLGMHTYAYDCHKEYSLMIEEIELECLMRKDVQRCATMHRDVLNTLILILSKPPLVAKYRYQPTLHCNGERIEVAVGFWLSNWRGRIPPFFSNVREEWVWKKKFCMEKNVVELGLNGIHQTPCDKVSFGWWESCKPFARYFHVVFVVRK